LGSPRLSISVGGCRLFTSAYHIPGRVLQKLPPIIELAPVCTVRLHYPSGFLRKDTDCHTLQLILTFDPPYIMSMS